MEYGVQHMKVIDLIDAALNAYAPTNTTIREITATGSRLLAARDLITGRADVDAVQITITRKADQIETPATENR